MGNDALTATEAFNKEIYGATEDFKDTFVQAVPLVHTRYPHILYPEGSFFLVYIIKTPPRSRGELVFELTPANSKICQVQVTHIGSNYPCLERPGGEVKPTDNMEITVTSQKATITFKVRIAKRRSHDLPQSRYGLESRHVRWAFFGVTLWKVSRRV